MAVVTDNNLALAVLEELGVIAEGETPNADSGATVKRRIGAVLAGLRDEGLAYWTADNTPLEVKEPMTKLVAFACMGVFQSPPMVQQLLTQVGYPMARKEIGKHVQARRAERPVVLEFF